MGVARILLHPAAKPTLFGVCLLPLAWLLGAVLTDRTGPNPAEYLIRSTGDWALRFLCLTLAVTPLRVLSRTPALARFRRMLGLFTYLYGALHAAGYVGFDMGLVLSDVLTDIGKRPFILVGFTAFLLMTPLAATSFNRAIRTLGAARWQMLHKLVYGVAVLAVLHFFWMRAGKNDQAEVLVYAAILTLLLGWRWGRSMVKNGKNPSSAGQS